MMPEPIQQRSRLSFFDEKGFTLIEVIVALAILTIGILSVNAMQTAAVRGNITANDITIASTWAADKVEWIFGTDYGDLEDENGDGLRSAQDANNDGIDDDDDNNDGNADGLTQDNIINFGLEEVNAPDYSDVSPDGKYTVIWNVAEDVPMPDTKTIYVIVSNDVTGKSVTLKHTKTLYF